MKTFIGTKIIQATPMTRAEYNAYRNWTLPANEDGSDPGYLVEYLDGGAPNHPDHKGYISWSPAEQFDAAYVDIGYVGNLQPHQARVVAEQAELMSRTIKLDAFTRSEVYKGLDREEQILLSAQLEAMMLYCRILSRRIDIFRKADPSVNHDFGLNVH